MLNSSDFKFEKFDPEFEDYWYKVQGESADYLTHKYMEQCMIGVTNVVYSKKENIVGIKRLFPFNFDVIMPKDDELKSFLIKLIGNNGGTRDE